MTKKTVLLLSILFDLGSMNTFICFGCYGRTVFGGGCLSLSFSYILNHILIIYVRAVKSSEKKQIKSIFRTTFFEFDPNVRPFLQK